jgi:hypothetical protein
MQPSASSPRPSVNIALLAKINKIQLIVGSNYSYPIKQDPVKILQKQHNPPFQEHYHLHFYDQFHPVKRNHIQGQLEYLIKLNKDAYTPSK